mgnify:CR=1 FL=1
MGPCPPATVLLSHRALELQDRDTGRVVGIHADLLAGDVLPDRVGKLDRVGEVDGVDAFKKRTEVTVRVQPIEEVEKELLETLSSIESQVIDVEAREVVFGARQE